MANKKLTEEEIQDRALELALNGIEKEFGKGAAYVFDDMNPEPLERYSSGNMELDEILGGGYPKGRIIELYGPESSGKTTIALHAIAEVQKAGGKVAFIDAEHALDPQYARALGIDMGKLVFSQPSTGEQALQIVDYLCRGACNMIVVDSVAALVPRAEMEGDIGDSHMGLQARLMGQALRKINGAVFNSDCVVIFINQIRMKLGVMFGNPETTPGGRALKFYSSIRIDVRRIGSTKRGTEIIANKVRVKTVKNKTFPPFRDFEGEIRFGEGLDAYLAMINMCKAQGIMVQSGSWLTLPFMHASTTGDDDESGIPVALEWTVKEMRLQGAEQVRAFLVNHPETMDYLAELLRADPEENNEEESEEGARTPVAAG